MDVTNLRDIISAAITDARREGCVTSEDYADRILAALGVAEIRPDQGGAAGMLGRAGGVARAKNLTPARRSEIASAAAAARWRRKKEMWDGPYCCDQMRVHSCPCDAHSDDPLACPDQLIYHTPVAGVAGIRVHDGGSSFVVIAHCPWCGVKLPGDTSLSGIAGHVLRPPGG